MGSASAQDFTMNATDFAAALLNQSIAGMGQAQNFLMIIVKTSGSNNPNIFQNLWGIAYGGVVLASINNQVTNMVLAEILDDNNTVDISAWGYGTDEILYDVIGYALNTMGSQGDIVFGDPAGEKGLARLLMAQVMLMENPSSYGYDYDFAAEYAKELAKTIAAGFYFTMELLKAIPSAFPNW
ncbi:MAG: hypothetical protein QXY19_02525 [Archaeoglobaceae archaeon]